MNTSRSQQSNPSDPTRPDPQPHAAGEARAKRDAPPRSRRRIKWTLAAITLLVVVLLVAVILLPTLLSTQPGNRTMIGWVNRQIAGSIEAERIAFGWLRGPVVTNLKLMDPQGRLVADVPRLAALEARPLSIAFGSSHYGDIDVRAHLIHVRQQRNEPTNLQLALASPDPTPEPEPEAPEPVEVDEDLSTRIQFSAESITYEGPDIEPVELTDVNALLDVRDIQSIGVELRSAMRHNDVDGHVAAQLRLTDMFTDEGELQWRRGGIMADMEMESLPIAAVDRLLQQDGRLAALLGPQLNAQVRTEGSIDALTAQITARSEHLNIEAQLLSDETSVTSPGATLALRVTPEAFAAWARMLDDAAAPQLLEPFMVHLELASLEVPRAADALVLEEAAIEASGRIDDILLRVPRPQAPAAPADAAAPAEAMELGLHGTTMSLSSAALNEQVRAQLRTEAAYEQVREQVQANLLVRGALGEPEARELALDAEALPVALADAIAGMEGRLTETLGPALNVRFAVAQPNEHQFTFNGEIQAERLAGSIQGQWDQQAQQGELHTPAPLQLTLTPAAYQSWVGDLGARLALVEPMEAAVDLHTLRVGLRDVPETAPDQPPAGLLARIDPQRTTFAMDLTTPRLVVEDPQLQERVSIANAEIRIPEGSLDEALEMFIEMRIEDLAEPQPQGQSQPRAGTLESHTRLEAMVGPDGTFQPMGARVLSNLTATQIPSQAVDMLAQQDGQLAALLGPRTSARATIDYQRQRGGEAHMELDTTNATGALAVRIDPEGYAHLIEDTLLTVAVTDDVSRVMLRRFNPLLGEVVAATAPISLRLLAEGSTVPIDPFEWEQVNMRGQLNMPRFTLHAAGFMDRAFQLMHVLGALPRAAQYEATLTPTDFEVQQGVLSYDQLGIALDDEMNLIFAGDVNLETQALSMDMSFEGAAYPREMRGMTLALGGTIDNPALDTDRIAQLLVRHGVQRGLGGLLGDRDEPEEDEDEEEAPERRRSPLEDIFERIR